MGFVSNSSTSSFAIFGLWFDSIDKIDKAIKRASKKEGDPQVAKDLSDKDLSEHKKAKIRDAIIESLGLNLFNFEDDTNEESDGVYLGINLEDLKGKLPQKFEKIKGANDSLIYLFNKEGQFISYAESDNG